MAAAPPRASLTRYAWLAVAAAVVTITLKTGAYLLTGSVGLLSDALESLVNLVAAVVGLIVLAVAVREANEEYAYGYAKAEYFSSGLEGMLVLVAALGIAATAVPRLLNPEPIEQVAPGLAVSVIASAINGGVAWRLFRAAKAHRSIALQASARHLMTDIWTSAGVVVGVALVALTGWGRLDALVALAVAANIIWTGWQLVRRSIRGLLDAALPAVDVDAVEAVLEHYRSEFGIQTHALRTREAGARRFMSVHVLVPGEWTVQRGHQLLEAMERDIHEVLPATTVFTHLESLSDPASWDDTTLDRSLLDAHPVQPGATGEATHEG